MPEIRYDIFSGDIVVVAGERAKRPSDFKAAQSEGQVVPEKDPRCPFCEGNESMTPPELYAERKENIDNTPGWSLRVVPNKFPAFVRKESLSAEDSQKCSSLEEEPPSPDDASMYWAYPAVGAHEVLIESPRHNATLGTLGQDQLNLILRTIKMRARILYDLSHIKYVHIFRNWGPRGGASLAHPHFQLMGLPLVPGTIDSETKRFFDYRSVTGRCLACDYLERETEKVVRIVKTQDEFIVLSPFAPKYSYETLILPRRHSGSFLDASEKEIGDLAKIISWLFSRYEEMFSSLSYNVIFHINPKEENRYYHWHIHIYPRLNVEAGLELGTGVYINPTSPEVATKEFLKQEELVRA